MKRLLIFILIIACAFLVALPWLCKLPADHKDTLDRIKESDSIFTDEQLHNLGVYDTLNIDSMKRDYELNRPK